MPPLTRGQLEAFRVPPRSIALWWLGQAGFIVKTPAGKIVAIDPYLSNSCQALGQEIGVDMQRMTPPVMSPADLLAVDCYLLTHSHQDHLDPQTLLPYLAAGGTGPFLAPPQTLDKLRSLGVPAERITMVWPSKQLTIGDLTVTATFAIPFADDDVTHVGYMLAVQDGPTVYFTGDTAYHEILAISTAPHRPDVLVSVINGAFRNMSPAEAARLAKQLNVRRVIPCHHDLFPDNSLPARLLRTNLVIEGIGDRFEELEYGRAFTYSADA